MAPTLTLYPDPPKKGASLLVCTDGTLPKKLDVNTVPPGQCPPSLTLVEPCNSVWIPSTCSSINFADPSNECQDESRVCV